MHYVAIAHNQNNMWHVKARYTTKVEGVTRTNATAPGTECMQTLRLLGRPCCVRSVYANRVGRNIIIIIIVIINILPLICNFSSGRALCGTRGDRRSDTYTQYYAHTPIRRRHKHTINIIVILIYSSVRIICECVLQVVNTALKSNTVKCHGRTMDH